MLTPEDLKKIKDEKVHANKQDAELLHANIYVPIVEIAEREALKIVNDEIKRHF